MSKINEYILNKKLNKLTNNIGKCTYENGKITCFVDKNKFNQVTDEKLILKMDLSSLKLNKPITEINYVLKDFYFYSRVYISNQINKNEVNVNVEFINCVFFNCISIFDINNLLFNNCVQRGMVNHIVRGNEFAERLTLKTSGIRKTIFNNSKFEMYNANREELGIQIVSKVVEMNDTEIFDRKKIKIFANNKLSLKNSLISCHNKIDISAFNMDYIDSDIKCSDLIELHTYSFIDYKKLDSPKIFLNGVCVKSSVKQKLIIDLLDQLNKILESSTKENINNLYPEKLEDISIKKKLRIQLVNQLRELKDICENNIQIKSQEIKENLNKKTLTKVVKLKKK